eukprot:TRINITY_DN11923_c0_g4_i1.p1 TRINITY_DN11923_c0_g4~~TRINITY_DN11923_c0_g4_i1.p1  ORF type:complete len:117 (+),score=3.21 TRINITY_DN11923_c0_g4_i1:645-995(+)
MIVKLASLCELTSLFMSSLYLLRSCISSLSQAHGCFWSNIGKYLSADIIAVLFFSVYNSLSNYIGFGKEEEELSEFIGFEFGQEFGGQLVEVVDKLLNLLLVGQMRIHRYEVFYKA